jgi:hypothetical protein
LVAKCRQRYCFVAGAGQKKATPDGMALVIACHINELRKDPGNL